MADVTSQPETRLVLGFIRRFGIWRLTDLHNQLLIQ
jgi:hypothetical protein